MNFVGILDISAGVDLDIVSHSYATVVAGASVHADLIIALIGIVAGKSDANSLSSLLASKFDWVTSEDVELVHLCLGQLDNSVIVILGVFYLKLVGLRFLDEWCW